MAFCANCGVKVGDIDKFCRECGAARVLGTASNQQKERPTTSDDTKNTHEEDKHKIEPEEKVEVIHYFTDAGSSMNLKQNIAGMLCYLGVWVTGIIFLTLEKKNQFVRFHAAQSLVVFGVLGLLSAGFSFIPFIGGFLSSIVGELILALWVVLVVKAYQGELYKLPLAGDIANSIVGKM
jgi:uncharacterized membrane protein